jgi:hypothetical protein
MHNKFNLDSFFPGLNALMIYILLCGLKVTAASDAESVLARIDTDCGYNEKIPSSASKCTCTK